MKTQQEIEAAKNLGREAFKAGVKRVPYTDKKLVAMLSGSGNLVLLEAWLNAWDKANLA